MITKITLTDSSGKIYELPHNILKLSAFSNYKATCLEVSIISKTLYVSQGEKLSMYIDGNLHFSGTIFAFSADYDTISITAYDNLLYFKSCDTFLVKNMTASAVLKEICSNIGVETGNIAETSFVLPYYLFENCSYFDIISSVLKSTEQVSGTKFVLSDKLGYICLNEQNSTYNIVEIDENILISTYKNTTAQDVYNAVCVYQIRETGEISTFYAYDELSIGQIGKIQKSINVDRNLSVAQCNLIAQNSLLDCENSIFSMEITIIALEIINIYDILTINSVNYRVIESVLNVSSTSETYALTLEKVVD